MLKNLTKYTLSSDAKGIKDITPRINSGSNKVAASMGSSKYKSTAMGAGGMGGGGAVAPSGGNNNTGSTSIGLTNVNINRLDGIISQDDNTLRKLYRDIYNYDGIAGAAVDLMSNLPFSDFSLTGVSDKKILETF